MSRNVGGNKSGNKGGAVAVTFGGKPAGKADTVVLPVFEGNRLSAAAAAADKAAGGLIRHALAGQGKFAGRVGQFLAVTAPPRAACARWLLAGLGDPGKLDEAVAETAGGHLFVALDSCGAVRARLETGGLEKSAASAPVLAARLAGGLLLRSYRFDKYRTKPAAQKGGKGKGKGAKAPPPALAVLEVCGPGAGQAEAAFGGCRKAAQGVFTARDFVNEPPNVLYPDSFARMIRDELRPLGVDVEILDHVRMKKLGFDAHLAVGMGSSRPPRVVVMRWNGEKTGAKKGKGPLAFVGKGVTFDTGGVDIKPADGMLDMKMDMAGAAAVAGLVKTLALRKAKVDVVGIAGLAENMPSHTAYRPSDVIGSRSGKTIEVLNTDAEGRLVLADALAYVQQACKPRLIVDLATLTGAIMVALGYEYAGAFVNDDALWKQLDEAGKKTGEKLWRMPLDESFRKELDSQIADIKSIGNNGRYGGACTAAAFLERFVESGTPWAHIDIAGTAWINRDRPLGPKPATGFGVRLLDRFVADNYEG